VPAPEGAGVSKSAVSRRFVALSAARMTSDLSRLDPPKKIRVLEKWIDNNRVVAIGLVPLDINLTKPVLRRVPSPLVAHC